MVINALEGNTLTESETKVLLEDGLSVGEAGRMIVIVISAKDDEVYIAAVKRILK